jgi:glycosyltransferase involved in cell wall biosynthesis
MTDAAREATPLVSVGMPCFNRPELLLRAVRAVQAQTYRNLEIIISDNASTDPEVERMCRELADSDKRVDYVRQTANLGAVANFEFALQRATADYFMWAADDDWIEPTFIQLCLDVHLREGEQAVLVTPEAQYELPDGSAFEYFSEGSGLRNGSHGNALARMHHLLDNMAANSIYGLFRRHALFHQEKPITQWLVRSELPVFLLLASKGQIHSVDTIAWHKRATKHICQHMMWEHCGGRKPGGPAFLNPSRMRTEIKYHAAMERIVEKTVADINMGLSDRTAIIRHAKSVLRGHLWHVLIGWKPLRRSAPDERFAATIE